MYYREAELFMKIHSAINKHSLKRRDFIGQGSAVALSALGINAAEAASSKPFHLWASGDCHVGTDKKRGRESLAEAIRQSEFGDSKRGAPSFDWDIALHVGDFSGNQGSPKDDEGEEVVRQLAAMKKHRREDFYSLAGNHDASFANEERQWWFRKWLDPTGENTVVSGVDNARRRFPVSGTWERYSFRVGNMLFLIMSDRNDGGPPVGRGKRGGYPAGAVSSETFAWWKDQVESNQDSIIICAHHHMLRETTVASGPWEGFRKKADGGWKPYYHGYYPKGGPEGASYLYWLDDKPDAQAFEKYLAQHPGAIDMWIGGHTHTSPDDSYGGRSHVEQKWGAWFVNCSALTRYHVNVANVPMSRLLTFTPGSEEVLAQCYLHTNQHARAGWYEKAERKILLKKKFVAAKTG